MQWWLLLFNCSHVLAPLDSVWKCVCLCFCKIAGRCCAGPDSNYVYNGYTFSRSLRCSELRTDTLSGSLAHSRKMAEGKRKYFAYVVGRGDGVMVAMMMMISWVVNKATRLNISVDLFRSAFFIRSGEFASCAGKSRLCQSARWPNGLEVATCTFFVCHYTIHSIRMVFIRAFSCACE